MNSFVFDRLAPASVHGMVALIIAFIVTRVFHKLPADCQAWIWRLAIARFLLALVWEMPIGLLPAAKPELTEVTGVPVNMVMSEPVASAAPPVHPLTWIWAIGTLGILLFGFAKWFNLWRLSRRAYAVENGVRVSYETPVPFLIGQTIVLPAEMPDDARDMALAHELAHRARRDPLYSLPNFAVSAVFWFVLPVWLALREYAIQVEIDCDRRALRLSGVSPRHYGWLLVALATGNSSPVGSAAMAGSPSALRRRIKAMKNTPNPRKFTTLALTLALGALVVMPIRPVEAAPQSAEVKQSQAQVEKAQKQLNQALAQLKNAVQKETSARKGVASTAKSNKGKTVQIRKGFDLAELDEITLLDMKELQKSVSVTVDMARAHADMAKAMSAKEKAMSHAEIARAMKVSDIDVHSKALRELSRAEGVLRSAESLDVKKAHIRALEKELERLKSGYQLNREMFIPSPAISAHEVPMSRFADTETFGGPAAIAPLAEAPGVVRGIPLTVAPATALSLPADTREIRVEGVALAPTRTVEGHPIIVREMAIAPAARAGAVQGLTFTTSDRATATVVEGRKLSITAAESPIKTRTTTRTISSTSPSEVSVGTSRDGTVTITANGKTQVIKLNSGSKTITTGNHRVTITRSKSKDGTLTVNVTTIKK